mmetsp:Transcript_25031/g.52951  ORF Transcript_25031/g.52951 Transcript_25031/m.52951 type:complete len:207 (-) Transcript_25031:70-690(-)
MMRRIVLAIAGIVGRNCHVLHMVAPLIFLSSKCRLLHALIALKGMAEIVRLVFLFIKVGVARRRNRIRHGIHRVVLFSCSYGTAAIMVATARTASHAPQATISANILLVHMALGRTIKFVNPIPDPLSGRTFLALVFLQLFGRGDSFGEIFRPIGRFGGYNARQLRTLGNCRRSGIEEFRPTVGKFVADMGKFGHGAFDWTFSNHD